MSETISWIGCGKVGRTLARALRNAGYPIGVIYNPHPQSAREARIFIGAGEVGSDPVSAARSGTVHFITTNDDSIPLVVADIDQNGPDNFKDHYFFHTSGALGSEVLGPLKKKGAEVGSIHPLQVFADPAKALETLPGTYYAIEGVDRAMSLAIQMVDRLQGKLLLIPTGRKILYHAAGVFAANYLTVLVNIVLSIMEEIGEDSAEAYQAFLPLMVGALENIEEFGVEQALTGPISRGDSEVVQKHLHALQNLDPEFAKIYRMLGQQALQIVAKGDRISAEKAKRLLKLLESEGEA